MWYNLSVRDAIFTMNAESCQKRNRRTMSESRADHANPIKESRNALLSEDANFRGYVRIDLPAL